MYRVAQKLLYLGKSSYLSQISTDRDDLFSWIEQSSLFPGDLTTVRSLLLCS